MPPADWAALVATGGVFDDRKREWFPDPVVRDGRVELARLAGDGVPLDAYAAVRPLLRPNLVRLSNCTGVRLAGVTFENSAMWNVHPSLCHHVDVRGVTIFNPAWAQNGDGIDLDSCRHVTVASCTVNAGGDAICLKSGQDTVGRRRDRPTEDVTITDCAVGTDNGLRFKSARGRGGVVEDVVVDGLTMHDIGGTAVLFDLFYTGRPPPPVTEATPAFRDVHIRHVTCDGADEALRIRGLPEMPIRDVSLVDVRLRATAAGVIADAVGVECQDVFVTANDRRPVAVDARADVRLTRCSGFPPNGGRP